jgi:hypothetical protein
VIARHVAVVSTIAALTLPAARVVGQAVPGPTEHTTCPTPVRPATGLTFHGGYAWNVTYHTFPYQFGFAQYAGQPDPAMSDDGGAKWTNPGVYVECTLTWYYNPDGSVAYVDFRWHIISYSGNITENDVCGGEDDDSIYVMSYDPYASGHDSIEACDGVAGSGGGADAGGLTPSCAWQWLELEISYDGGVTWQQLWTGWVQVCEQ